MDGVTGRLRVNIAATASPSPQVFAIAKRDGNRVRSAMCVLDDGTLQGVLVDANRNLFVMI